MNSLSDPLQYARRWKTLGVLSLSLVIIGLDTTLLNVALPTLQDELDASASKLQWMVDAYLLVLAGLLLVFGTLGDRYGRKLALQAGVSIFGLASLGALVADSADALIAVRAPMGIGAALIMPATLSIIANVFSGPERGKAIGIWAALAAVGIGLGPLAGGLLLEWFDWSSVFVLNVPFAAVALLLGIRYVPESRDPHPGSFDPLGAVLSTVGFTALVFAIVEAPDEGWLSGLVLGALAVAAGLLAAFLWWELECDEPMLDLGFFRDAAFSVGTAAVSIAFFALMGGIFILTQYLQFAHGYSAIQAGAIMSPMTLGLVLGAGSSSRLVARAGVARVVGGGLAGLAIMLGLTPLFDPETGSVALLAWFLGIALFMGWTWRRRPTRSWARSRPPNRASLPPPTRSRGWSRARSASRSSARSSTRSTRTTSATRSGGCRRERAPPPRTRLARRTPLPPSSRPTRRPACCPPPATHSPTRWASGSRSARRSPPRWRCSSCDCCRRPG